MTDIVSESTDYRAYGKYCGYRDAAWRCLADHQIDRLPVDVKRIAALSGIRVLSDREVHLLRPNETGATFYDGVRWSIVYDSDQTVEACRLTVAHELGHIFLGHGLQTGDPARADMTVEERLKHPEINKNHEREADRFAIRLLCPACVLWALDLHTAEEIATACRIPMAVAKKRAARMATLYKRNCFLHSELEREVFRRFEPYIREERSARGLAWEPV